MYSTNHYLLFLFLKKNYICGSIFVKIALGIFLFLDLESVVFVLLHFFVCIIIIVCYFDAIK